MNDDDICLNLDSSFTEIHQKRPKTTKIERLKLNKQKRKAADDVTESQSESSRSAEAGGKVKQSRGSGSTNSAVSSVEKSETTETRKRKRSAGAERRKDTKEDVPGKRLKFSSLYTNNPEIPHVESIDVQPVNEVVFSDKSFKAVQLHPFMVSNLEKIGITTMTSVQQASIPVVLQGRDVLIRSQTGSGKTLSYAVPIVEKLQSLSPKVNRADGPYCIVIVPTRELALQSIETFQKLVKPFQYVVPGCIMGGERKKSEKARLRRGINILVATPGRLVDHLTNTQSLLLSHVKFLVIDEADRLLDMGFEKDVSKVISALGELRQTCQTILLSATLSAGVERLAGISLQNPVTLDVTQQPAGEVQNVSGSPATTDATRPSPEFAVPESLTHSFVIVPSKLRLVTLAAFLLWKCKLGGHRSKMIVFLATQDAVDFHFELLEQCLRSEEGKYAGFDAEDGKLEKGRCDLDLFKLHGDMPQKERTKVFHDFHSIESGVLLCTDVAARGLDLPHVDWIVQYNTPGSPTDYIHRVGRTARIGVRGNALLFLTPAEVKYVAVLAEHKISMKELQVDDILKTLMTCQLVHKGERARSAPDCAAFLQARFERHVHDTLELRTLARKAFQSFIRSYATYPSNLKYVFHVKNLHLGHVAKSFALGETPSKVSALVGRQVARVAQGGRAPRGGKHGKGTGAGDAGKFASGKPKRRPMHLDPMSEFASGFD